MLRSLSRVGQLALLCLLAAGVTAAAAGGRRRLAGTARPGPAIFNGFAATRGQFQYMAILAQDDGGAMVADSWYCGASLIRPRLLVTAAHCLFDDSGQRTDPTVVYIGMLDIANDGLYEGQANDKYDRRVVRRVVKHPRFDNSGSTAFDIALIVLEEASRFTPVALARQAPQFVFAFPVRDQLLVAGFGVTADSDGSAALRYGRVPFINRPECMRKSEETGMDPPPVTHICAGGAAMDSCAGDSGGPLVKPTPAGHVLVGLVSYGARGTCGGSTLGAYTSIMWLRPWIDGWISALGV